MKEKIKLERDQIYATPDMLKGGLYFKESVKWYISHCISPVKVSFGYVAICFIYIISILFATVFVVQMFPLRETVGIVIKTDRPAGTYLRMRHLKRYVRPSDGILMAVIEDYVKNREQYVVPDGKTPLDVLNEKKSFIALTSSEKVSQKYNEWVTGYNSVTGDFLLAGVETVVSITSSEFDEPPKSFLFKMIDYFLPVPTAQSATVYFTSTNSRNRQRTLKTNISYSFALSDGNHKQNQIYFEVLSYAVSVV